MCGPVATPALGFISPMMPLIEGGICSPHQFGQATSLHLTVPDETILRVCFPRRRTDFIWSPILWAPNKQTIFFQRKGPPRRTARRTLKAQTETTLWAGGRETRGFALSSARPAACSSVCCRAYMRMLRECPRAANTSRKSAGPVPCHPTVGGSAMFPHGRVAAPHKGLRAP